MTTEPISEKYASCSTDKFIIWLFINFSLKKVGHRMLTKKVSWNFITRSS